MDLWFVSFNKSNYIAGKMDAKQLQKHDYKSMIYTVFTMKLS